jgi:hypothetical protein
MKQMDSLESITNIAKLFDDLPQVHQRTTVDLLEERMQAARTAPARRALRRSRNKRKKTETTEEKK